MVPCAFSMLGESTCCCVCCCEVLRSGSCPLSGVSAALSGTAVEAIRPSPRTADNPMRVHARQVLVDAMMLLVFDSVEPESALLVTTVRCDIQAHRVLKNNDVSCTINSKKFYSKVLSRTPKIFIKFIHKCKFFTSIVYIFPQNIRYSCHKNLPYKYGARYDKKTKNTE